MGVPILVGVADAISNVLGWRDFSIRVKSD